MNEFFGHKTTFQYKDNNIVYNINLNVPLTFKRDIVIFNKNNLIKIINILDCKQISQGVMRRVAKRLFIRIMRRKSRNDYSLLTWNIELLQFLN